MTTNKTTRISLIAQDYGMVVVLLLLMVVMSLITIDRQEASGSAAGKQLANAVKARSTPQNIVIATPEGILDYEMAEAMRRALEGSPHRILAIVQGGPRDANLALQRIKQQGDILNVIVGTQASSKWDPLRNASAEILVPTSYLWPDFLMTDNLVTIAQRIVIIAIIAIGMTMVIITGGIDLSVGSLIALSAVVTGILIRDWGGGKDAGAMWLILASMGGMLACAVIGFSTGFLVAAFRLAPFIVTLAMMLIVRGVANVLSDQRTIHEIPESFDQLGKGYLGGIPYSVMLMFGLYAIAWLVMGRTTLGRQIYAVGGNEEAARLSGVPVKRILLIVYTICGLLAGLGGVILCSQLRSAKASYGQMDELTVIAAVVVGGTSLMGGQGKVLGTLIGALIIGVIQNGMNLVHMDDKTQMIVLGSVIVIAVLLDRVKKGQIDWLDVKGVFTR